jgi:hypothetical protein
LLNNIFANSQNYFVILPRFHFTSRLYTISVFIKINFSFHLEKID